jgi:hypothetical protein
MGAKKPPPHEAVTIISGDWSTGFNAASSSSLSDAKLLAHIGSNFENITSTSPTREPRRDC